MECIVITGGSSFLGSYFCKEFSKNYKVICVDIKFKNNFLSKNIDRISCNISNVNEVKKN